MAPLGSQDLLRSQHMLRVAHWDHFAGTYGWSRRTKIALEFSSFLRTFWVNAKHVLFHPTGKSILFLLGKGFVFFHLWNHGLQVLGSCRARRHLRGHLALLLTLSLSSHSQDWVPGDVNFELPLALACCVIWGKLLALSEPQLSHLSKERCALVCWAFQLELCKNIRLYRDTVLAPSKTKDNLVYRGSTASRKNYICYIGQIEQDLLRDLENTRSIQKTFSDTLKKEGVWNLAFLVKHLIGLYGLGHVNYSHGIHLLHL